MYRNYLNVFVIIISSVIFLMVVVGIATRLVQIAEFVVGHGQISLTVAARAFRVVKLT